MNIDPQLLTKRCCPLGDMQAGQHFNCNTAGADLVFDLEDCIARYTPQASAERNIYIEQEQSPELNTEYRQL